MSTVTANTTRVQNWLARLIYLLRNSDPDFAELLSGLLGFFWGLWLLNPAWDSFSSTVSFAAMAAIAPEEYWGAAIMVGGMFQMYVVLQGDFVPRMAAALGAIGTWALIASMIAVSNFAATGTVVYSGITLIQVWACWRVADLDATKRGK